MIMYGLFFFGSKANLNPYVVGIVCGSCVGPFWAMLDSGTMLVSESTPTSVRMIVSTVQNLLSGCIYGIAMITNMILINILGDKAIGTITTILTFVGLSAGVIVMFLKIKELTI